MSCHDIGHGMNNVATEILKCYDAGKMDFDTARRLIITCRESVWFCDGNPDEAVTVFEKQNRCSCCLKTDCSAEDVHRLSDRAADALKKPLSVVAKEVYRDRITGCTICPACLQEYFGIELPSYIAK